MPAVGSYSRTILLSIPTSKALTKWLKGNRDLKELEWPAQSPDLNPKNNCVLNLKKEEDGIQKQQWGLQSRLSYTSSVWGNSQTRILRSLCKFMLIKRFQSSKRPITNSNLVQSVCKLLTFIGIILKLSFTDIQ